MSAHGQEDGLVSLLEKVVDGEVPAQGLAGLDLDVVLADEADVVLQILPGQPVIRDAHGQHAAGHGQGFEDGHRIPSPSQMVGRIQALPARHPRRPPVPSLAFPGKWAGPSFPVRAPNRRQIASARRWQSARRSLPACTCSRRDGCRPGRRSLPEAWSAGSGSGPLRIFLRAIRAVYPTASQRTGQVFSQGAKTRASQAPAGQYFSRMWASYSCRKWLIVESTGLGQVWPRPQRAESLMIGPISRRSSISPSLPSPLVIRVRISSIRFVPMRQGTHLPQDSSWVKLRKKRAMSTMQVFSSMTIMPPDPIIEPACGQGLVVDGQIQILGGQASARRAAHLGCLEMATPGNSSADVEDDLAEGRPHGNFHKARVVDLPREGEDLGPLAALGPDGRIGGRSFEDDGADVGIGFDVVDVCGFAPESCNGRKGRPCPGHPPLALDRRQKGCLLAADKGAGPFLDLQVKTESGCPGYGPRSGPVPPPGPWRSSGAGRPGDIPPERRHSRLWDPMA